MYLPNTFIYTTNIYFIFEQHLILYRSHVCEFAIYGEIHRKRGSVSLCLPAQSYLNKEFETIIRSIGGKSIVGRWLVVVWWWKNEKYRFSFLVSLINCDNFRCVAGAAILLAILDQSTEPNHKNNELL